MRVADLLDGKEQQLLTIKPNETVGLLARKLQRYRVGVMVVSRDGQTIDGIVSERDIAYSLAERRGELHLCPVSAIMTRKVVTCTPSTKLDEVMHLMQQYHIRHIPVSDNGRLSGIIGMRDMMEFRLQEVEKRCKAVGHWAALTE
ncbi:histidine kinase [Hyphomicrobium methylovorum]|uniref:CBS domain-containing protein n=1 Tax=Hyphomicrobium methylovorum TaxID=84 RepID=UPI0015E7A0B5|nr:CBS domain-containing protein [Hyphomicrobium methylovorum]MBA2127441.1 histidine kinase [Hyphomicrobium methylovorum]